MPLGEKNSDDSSHLEENVIEIAKPCLVGKKSKKFVSNESLNGNLSNSIKKSEKTSNFKASAKKSNNPALKGNTASTSVVTTVDVAKGKKTNANNVRNRPSSSSSLSLNKPSVSVSSSPSNKKADANINSSKTSDAIHARQPAKNLKKPAEQHNDTLINALVGWPGYFIFAILSGLVCSYFYLFWHH